RSSDLNLTQVGPVADTGAAGTGAHRAFASNVVPPTPAQVGRSSSGPTAQLKFGKLVSPAELLQQCPAVPGDATHPPVAPSQTVPAAPADQTPQSPAVAPYQQAPDPSKQHTGTATGVNPATASTCLSTMPSSTDASPVTAQPPARSALAAATLNFTSAFARHVESGDVLAAIPFW